jgi:streptomycin 6-kinase
VLAHEGDAILMERASGARSLIAMARAGSHGDDEASRILCAAVAKLHAPRTALPPSTLVPLEKWFADLALAAETHGGVFTSAARTARELLASPRDVVPLHGDVHHGNILDFGDRGWLAIDPKGVIGERGYDFANIFCNPDAEVALSRGRLVRTLTVVADAAGLERERLLRWVLAYAGLSAAWSLEDGDDPGLALAVAEVAERELEP